MRRKFQCLTGLTYMMYCRLNWSKTTSSTTPGSAFLASLVAVKTSVSKRFA
ncbi:uncharacterized protein Asalp_19230 [Aeromonas salmonicida subsp. pectinolytica 34mel]|uniref:Uncharacterized protein n=1 Tax=Aeromonas salmonicida subsp. pectinolytica 34mel TaxID=1324960 RepID=A0A2D1QFU4_AERSA|nr:uncharacterized protein Asalp_19230 [Aeromonas salmonicida subsp. pectinolytica 34mel]